MDDIFKILIWGIIIFSFLRPLFKKKPTENKTPTSKSKSDGSEFGNVEIKEHKSSIGSQKNDKYDIIKEIENMFKGEVRPAQQQRTKPKRVDPYDRYESSEIKDKDLNLEIDSRMQREVEDQKPIGYRATYDKKDSSALSKQKRVIDAKTEAGALAFEKVLSRPRKQRAAVTEFNQKLKTPSNVREYILLSEILGKPIARRR